MCYSAQVWTDYRQYVRKLDADVNIAEFVELYEQRQAGTKAKIPKGMDAAFVNPTTAEQRRIRADIDAFNADQITTLEQDLFKQARRLADAERALQTRTTKKALNDQRIAGNKVKQIKARLAGLKRIESNDRDNRIFPLVYAPVLVWEDGRRVIRPMRYQCRPAGKPAFFDTKFPGTYNVRRDNLEGFWKQQFGHTHGLIVVSRFYENVEGDDGKNQVLQFTPQNGELMYIACLWSHWTGKRKDDDLFSFAAITDAPPAEVAAAGHDRCIINIKPEHIDAWLNPVPGKLAALHAILDDKQTPYYEHQMAA